jgi:hypothetical protein
MLTPPSGPALSGEIFNGVAVFDFTSINMPAGSSIVGSGALPLALLSRDGATFNGSVNVSAVGTNGGPGGGTGATLAGGGGPGGSIFGAGASFGGEGGASGLAFFPKPTYGDPTHAFFGGSGGGGGTNNPGGGGGGGLEISAINDILVAGSGILSNGFAGVSASIGTPGGGGSGGGILLATPQQVTLDLNTPLAANGGAGGGGQFSAGGGGGGRILIEADNFLTFGVPQISVIGGPPGAATNLSGTAGSPGTFDVTNYNTPVPEPASALSLALLTSATTLARRRPRTI